MTDYIDKIIREQYMPLVAECGKFEILLRLSAELNGIDINKKVRKKQKTLEDIEQELMHKLKGKVPKEDEKFLTDTRVMRNKIIHCSFRKLSKILKVTFDKRFNVSEYNLDTLDVHDITNNNGSDKVSAWLLQCASQCVFKKAYQELERANSIIDGIAKLG